MPIHQQLRSLECTAIETVASLLRGVMQHCLAGIQSHCPDNVDDIQAVRKYSTDQIWSTFVYCRLMKKILVFLFQETPMLAISFFEKWDLQWYIRSGEMSLFDKLILRVCLLHPVFLSDILSDVIGVTTKYSGDSAKAILPTLTTSLF